MLDTGYDPCPYGLQGDVLIKFKWRNVRKLLFLCLIQLINIKFFNNVWEFFKETGKYAGGSVVSNGSRYSHIYRRLRSCWRTCSGSLRNTASLLEHICTVGHCVPNHENLDDVLCYDFQFQYLVTVLFICCSNCHGCLSFYFSPG